MPYLLLAVYFAFVGMKLDDATSVDNNLMIFAGVATIVVCFLSYELRELKQRIVKLENPPMYTTADQKDVNDLEMK